MDIYSHKGTYFRIQSKEIVVFSRKNLYICEDTTLITTTMKLLFLVISALLLIGNRATACTSAIVTAQRSSEGAPLLWKHRDSKNRATCVRYYDNGKYAYTAITDSKDGSRSAYAGINETGFGIINTATKNLPCSTEEECKACTRKEVGWGAMWHYALRNCATVDEFEEFLRKTKRRHKFGTNFAVADGTGAVAYFEIGDLYYHRYDTTDRKEGFDVRSNFSFAGIEKKRGVSARRYDVVMKEMSTHEGNFTPQQFYTYSRSYNSCAYGDILANDDEYVCSNHAVPRVATTGVFVLVCDAKCPRMLVTIGHSVPGIAVPIYVQAKNNIPECVKGSGMLLLSNDFKAKAYHRIKGKGAVLQKDVVRKVLTIKQPEVVMPQQMPENIEAFNAKIDKQFNKHAKRVRKVLAKF